MDEHKRCESLLRRAWDLHIKIGEMQAARKAQREEAPDTGGTDLEIGLDALLLAMECQVDQWLRQLWRTLGELEQQHRG